MKDLILDRPKPFLRWAGGKKWLIKDILKIIPKDYNNYYEPFLGAGNIYFNLQPSKAFLSEINKELINTYNIIKNDIDPLIKALKRLKNDESSYYKVREKEYKNEIDTAAKFIYLNKTCWNGLYRVNKDGRFNVPYGHKKNIIICDEDNLRIVSHQLKTANIICEDFEEATSKCKKKDLIYFDPPYTVAHQNNGFIQYNAKIFSWTDQKRLADVFRNLHSRGCYLILSNAYHDSVKDLYIEFNKIALKRMSTISASVQYRKEINEILITNF